MKTKSKITTAIITCLLLTVVFCGGCGNKKEKIIINQWYYNDTVHHQDILCDTFYEGKNFYWIYYNDNKKDSIRACWLSTDGR
jgi:hypothetical protein